MSPEFGKPREDHQSSIGPKTSELSDGRIPRPIVRIDNPRRWSSQGHALLCFHWLENTFVPSFLVSHLEYRYERSDEQILGHIMNDLLSI